jgi:hypothetical protein
LEATGPLIEKSLAGINTQLNESLHSLKAKTAEKSFNWKTTWKARCCVALLNWNEGDSWKLEMYQALGFPELAPEIIGLLEKEQASKEARAKSRSDKGHQEKGNARRDAARTAETEVLRVATATGELLHLDSPWTRYHLK